MRKIYTAFARNTVFANIVILMILFAGVMAVRNMVIEAFPEIALDVVAVAVPWPGADPEEVEEGICRKIEEAIEGIDGIKQYNSTASENMGSVVIEVLEGYEVEYVKERVRNAVESISTFPQDAERPITQEALFTDEVMILSLGGEGLNERDRKEWAEEFKEEIRSLPGVSQVRLIGSRDYEIGIEVSEERLREYGLTFSEVASIVRASSLNRSGGVMRTQGEEIRLRTMGRKYRAEEFAEIVVLARPNGEIITLDRIADIRDDFVEDRRESLFNGQRVTSIIVDKTKEEDTLGIDKAVRELVAAKREQVPEGMSIEIWGGSVDILRARIRLLSKNGVIGLILVFILLWLFLDIRLSFWAGMGMPISVAGALAIMWGLGATINMISLFGLIMVLGIIVDDAIVVGEAIYVARKNGTPPLKAAIDGVSEVGMPVIAAVTTTIVAFIPLYYVAGLMGKFIMILPVVVISSLSISLLECLLLLPAHLSHLPDPEHEEKAESRVRKIGKRFHRLTNHGMEYFVEQCYEPAMGYILRWRYVGLALALMVLMLTWGVIESGLLKFTVFPKVEGNMMRAQIEFPNGAPLHVTRDAIARMEGAIKRVAARTRTISGEPLIQHIYAVAGVAFGDGDSSLGSNLGTMRIELLDYEKRGVSREKILVDWEEEIGEIPGVLSMSISGPGGLPGSPIEIWLQGHNMAQLQDAAEAVKEKLESYAGLYQIQDDFRPGKNEFKLHLKPQARAMGFTVADLARQIYAGYYGEQAIRMQRGRDDVRVRVRYPQMERRRLDDFEQIRVRTPQGFEVPLGSVAEIDFGPGYASIKRTDGMRRISVTADVDAATANANEVLNDLSERFLPALMRSHPGIKYSLQGEKKNMRESFSSMYISYPLALIAIFIIIATVFRSYIQPLIIMITVPFGIIGAVLGHMALGYELSMMSFFGMVALSGVVVNDAIVLIECVNTNLMKGLPFFEAVSKAGARRFRAIFLTTVSTVGGLMPLIIEQDRQAQFLVPMAIAIAAGVAFATLLTLVLIPCLFCILNDIRCLSHWLLKGVWPDRAAVEPARKRNYSLAHEEALENEARRLAEEC